MLRLHSSHPVAWVLAMAGASLVLNVRDASACGGCFHPPPAPLEVETSLVTDHRMAFSLSTTQTVLWDQIRYSGNPKAFAWVLPVRPGARIELSQDAWIAALDASTQTVVTGPTSSCGGTPTSYSSGCSFGFGARASGEAVPAGFNLVDAGEGQVQVISHQVVGPYDAVTVRSTQGEALGDWLRVNGYDIPPTIQPVIDAYSSESFDFIALRLAPSRGVQDMQPVRVITPGADATLPLRMVAAGVGAHVGLELYVLSEGRYHPSNFPDASIDFTKLAWDPNASRSNYAELATEALASSGTGWLTESSQPANLYGFNGSNPGLGTTYESTCRLATFVSSNCGAQPSGSPLSPDAAPEGSAAVADAGDGAPETGGGDSSDDGAAKSQAGDAAPETGPAPMPVSDAASTCGAKLEFSCDDLSVAMTGIAPGRLWVTRLRADLPATALSQDLLLEATASQNSVSNSHHTNAYTIANFNPCGSTKNAATSTSSSGNGNSSGCGCRAAESRDRDADVLVWSLGAATIVLSLRRRKARAGS
jgi:hypothetical protein